MFIKKESYNFVLSEYPIEIRLKKERKLVNWLIISEVLLNFIIGVRNDINIRITPTFV